MADELIVDVPTIALKQIRIALEKTTRSQALSTLISDTIEDLVNAAMTRDSDDVGALEIESVEGDWHLAIRLSRDSDLRNPVCARGRARGWR